MAAKALTYAEEYLEVHKIFEEANAAQEASIKAHANLNKARVWRRDTTEAIADREVAVWSELRKQNPEMSATALDVKVKFERRVDTSLKEMRHQLSVQQAHEDTSEAEVRHAENRIKIATARMTELGGYLNYLATIKTVQAIIDDEVQKAEKA